MRIHLLAVGTRAPVWIRSGYEEFAARLPRECSLNLVEIAAGRRGKSVDVARVLRNEGERMLAAVPPGARVVSLDVGGQQWHTEELAAQLQSWMQDGRDVALLVGGPEGLDGRCKARAEQSWSLSQLTFPHLLVRILIAEQVYRAWSILSGHPYHRA